MLSNVVSEMVIVTAPLEPSAEMAPPYKVDVPPPDMQRKFGIVVFVRNARIGMKSSANES